MVTLGETNFEGKLRMLVRRLSMVLPALNIGDEPAERFLRKEL